MTKRNFFLTALDTNDPIWLKQVLAYMAFIESHPASALMAESSQTHHWIQPITKQPSPLQNN